MDDNIKFGKQNIQLQEARSKRKKIYLYSLGK